MNCRHDEIRLDGARGGNTICLVTAPFAGELSALLLPNVPPLAVGLPSLTEDVPNSNGLFSFLADTPLVVVVDDTMEEPFADPVDVTDGASWNVTLDGILVASTDGGSSAADEDGSTGMPVLLSITISSFFSSLLFDDVPPTVADGVV